MKVLILLVLGLAWGSFVNAFVWRLHMQSKSLKKDPKSKTKNAKYSILHGRSMCVHCRHVLAWYDLLPVVSWLSLKGRCRYCRKPVSWQYPLVELATAGLFVGSFLAWPSDIQGFVSVAQFVIWLVFLVGFMALAVYDLRWMLLPNKIVFPLIALALAQVLFVTVAEPEAALRTLLGALLGFVAIGGLFWALFEISHGKWIGGGDVKLGFMIGPLVGGPTMSLLVIFIASTLGSLVSIPLLARKALKPSSRIPFGPFLLVATVIVYLYGQRIIDWYMHALI